MLDIAAERESGASSADPLRPSSSTFQFRPTSAETMRTQYSGTSDPPRRALPLLAPRTSKLGLGGGLSSFYGSSSSSLGEREPPLTMTFPSNFAYSNLSPSHFAGTGDFRPALRPAASRDAAPPGALSSATMTFDAAMFPQQPWGSATPQAAPAPGFPATLQTTEDLRAYLEHQVRLGRHHQVDYDLDF